MGHESGLEDTASSKPLVPDNGTVLPGIVS
jgi:hypothetical protein